MQCFIWKNTKYFRDLDTKILAMLGVITNKSAVNDLQHEFILCIYANLYVYMQNNLY